MTQYWIVYDKATGELLYNGCGSSDSSAFQRPPEGTAIVAVPQEVVLKPGLDLDALRRHAIGHIDDAAEEARGAFVTGGPRKQMAYARKEAAAHRVQADPTASVPILAAEAAGRGLTVPELAALVLQRADESDAALGAIEAASAAAKEAVAKAENVGRIVDAYLAAFA